MAQVDLNRQGALPVEMLSYIFKYDTSELLNLALVCKIWKNVACSRMLQNMIRPSRAIGLREMKKINTEIVSPDSEEAPLPLEVFKNIGKKEEANLKDYWLVYKPSSVKVKDQMGKPVDLPINNLQTMGNLFGLSFTEDSYAFDFEKENNEKKSRWIWIEHKVHGFERYYSEQLGIAQSLDKEVYPERYSPKPNYSWPERSRNAQPGRFNHQPKKNSRPNPIIQMAEIHELALGMMLGYRVLNEIPFSGKDLIFNGYVLNNTMTINQKGDSRKICYNNNFEGVCLRTKTITVSAEGQRVPLEITFKKNKSCIHVTPGSTDPWAHVGFVCVRKSLGINAGLPPS